MPIHTLPEPAAQRVAIIRQLARPSAMPAAGDEPLPELNDPSEAPASAGAVPIEKKGISKWAKMLYGAGLGADVGTTLHGFSKGSHEANPLINFAGDKAAVPIMLAGEMGSMLLAKKLLGDRHPKIMNAIMSASGIAHGAAALHNARLPRAQAPSAGLPVQSHETIVYDTGNGGFVPPK